jgi:hypothetical protein
MANFNTNTLIDTVLLRTENQSSTDAANSPRRTRILEWAQQAVDELWNLRPWAWTLSSTSLTVTASSASLPSDFQEIGPEGGAWQTSGVSNPHRLEEVSPQVVEELQNSSQSISLHRVFAVYGVADTVATQLFQVAPCSGSTTFGVTYKTLAPTLSDVDSTSSGLQYIPASYHYSVILPAVQAFSARSKGHARQEQSYTAAKNRGVQDMISREQRRRSTTQRFGRPLRRGW